MGTLISAILANVRIGLREPSAVTWTDAELIEDISRNERRLFDELGGVAGAGRATRQDEITVAANGTTFTLATGSPPTGLTSEFVAIDYIEWDDGSGVWEPIGEIPRGQEWRWDTVDDAATSALIVPGYLVRESTLVVKPKIATARTLRLSYFYRPAVKTTTASTLDTPVRWDELIEQRAISKALGKINQADDRVEQRILALVDEMQVTESNRQPRERAEVVRRVYGRR